MLMSANNKNTSRYTAGLLILLMSLIVSASSAQVIRDDDPSLRNIDIIEHQRDTIPFDVVLTNDAGQEVTLGQYFEDGKPTILIMAYYTCPMLCNLVLNGVADAARAIDWIPGEEYQILTVSIDPTEMYDLAAAKKKNYLANIGRPDIDDGWTFFAATEDQSRKLADAIGFKYYYDEDLEQYAHAAVITILTGKGVISRYLYGIEFKERDYQFALMEASEGKIGNTIDRVLLYCFHYDPDAGGYVLFAANVMKLGGVVTLVFLALFLGFFWIRELRRRSRKSGATGEINAKGPVKG